LLVSPNYRLVPEVDVPTCVEDCAAALRWVYRHIEGYGGDPDRIVLGGHSAGGHIAALLALDRQRAEAAGIPLAAVRACFPLCGIFSLVRSELLPDSFFHNIYDEMFAADGDAVAVSAYSHAGGNRIPFNLTWGEKDVPDVIADNRRFSDLAGREGFLTAARIIAGAGHFAAHLECLDDQSPWFSDLKSALYPV